jgi:hypothetical protein
MVQRLKCWWYGHVWWIKAECIERTCGRCGMQQEYDVWDHTWVRTN